MSETKETYRLAQIPCFAFKPLERIVFKDGNATTEKVPRNGLLSRMLDYDNLQDGIRYMIPHKTDFYIPTLMEDGEDGKKKEVKQIYRLNEAGDRYVPFADYSHMQDADVIGEIEQGAKKAMITQKLSGRSAILISDQEFSNGKNLTIHIRNADTEYDMVHHNEYIRVLYRIYYPYITPEGKVDAKLFEYTNMFYRYSAQSNDSWLNLPTGHAYIIVNANEHDTEHINEAQLFIEGEQQGDTEKDMATLISKHEDMLKENAARFRLTKLIPLADDFTEVFMQLNTTE